jgi:3-oxoacyl-[acyl-carrier-protein] synthase-3
MQFHIDPRLEEYLLEYVPPAVEELLALEGLALPRVQAVLPPQLSSQFITALADRLGMPRERFVDIAAEGADYFTSTLACTMEHARKHGLVKRGDVALVINVGSGLQVGSAAYYC